MHGTHRATRQEYAIKVLDKGHLKRNNKLNTALAEKNTLVRLGSGHPGIVRLHWAFQDEWSLCELICPLLVLVSSVKGGLRRSPSDGCGGGPGASPLAKGDRALHIDDPADDTSSLCVTSGGDLPIHEPSLLPRPAVRLP